MTPPEQEQMYALHEERMLQAWERGREFAEPWRALALLEAAMPEHEIESLASLPLAKRNALLMKLRLLTFGNRLEGFAQCPECGTQLELALNAEDLEGALEAPAQETWTERDTEMCMRPVNTQDLAAAMTAIDAAEARMLLLERTVSPRKTRSLDEEAEPDCTGDWIDRFERLNASAEILCALRCPGCEQRPVLDLDIARFFWREIAVAARRLLAEVHCLARAYGWSEQQIVSMSAARRASYLEMLKA
jgi:hypothetical protein